ncbi:Transmembrane protein, partial [Phytophthora palmivora]
VGVALGRGTMRSASTPQRIDLPSLEANDDTIVSTMPPTTFVGSVSCGSGFCVAVTRDGHAFSWGKWSDGRLGLGRIPIIARTSRRHSGRPVRKQFQSFQLTPKQIQHISTIEANSANCRVPENALFSKVSCGDAHCVGLTRTGELVTWGRGNNGQQGRGDARDTLVPTTVLRNVSEQKLWCDVAAGENWSMVLSSDGQVWSWGACGGAVLGHGLHGSQKNALLAEMILQRHQRLISQRNKSSSYSCPRVPCLRWMTPQMIPCFATPDIRICRISAGAQHAAAISDTGDLYMWGEDYTETHSETSISDRLLLSSLPKLLNSGQREENYDQHNVGIGIRSVEHVVCGGRQTIVFTSGSFLARSMTKLYRDSITYVKLDGPHKNIDLAGGDLVLVVSGHRLLAHKLLLAQRSSVLRELILDEEQQQQIRLTADEGGSFKNAISSTEPMELLLPRLRVDVARALVEFIYTDNFTVELNNSSYYLVNDVLRAAKIYKLPSLVHLCRERLFSRTPSSLLQDEASSPLLHEIDEESSDTNSEHDEEKDDDNSKVARTLNDDMKFALNDEVWADTVLVSEGCRIPVHRCMLIARSEYFRAVLAFHLSALNEPPDSKMLVLNVDDSYAGIVRVLRFIYYDQVALPQLKRNDNTMENGVNGDTQHDPEDVSDQLLEDLVAADKYGLERMKRLCEHAICLTVVNCLEVLAVAELVHAAHLKQVAMRFVQTHLPDITARQEEFHRFQEDFPQLLEELYVSLRDASRDEFLLREWHTEVGTCLTAQHEEQELQWSKKSTTASFPWVPLSLTVAFGAMYLSVMNAEEHEFSAVPATNIAAITAIGGAILMGYL